MCPSIALGKAGWLSSGELVRLCTLVSLGCLQKDWGERRFLHYFFRTFLQVSQDLISCWWRYHIVIIRR